MQPSRISIYIYQQKQTCTLGFHFSHKREYIKHTIINLSFSLNNILYQSVHRVYAIVLWLHSIPFNGYTIIYLTCPLLKNRKINFQSFTNNASINTVIHALFCIHSSTYICCTNLKSGIGLSKVICFCNFHRYYLPSIGIVKFYISQPHGWHML